jgi:integrase/recombinase XerC
MADEWLGDLRAVKGLRRSTIRNYALTLSAFCRYLTDPAYLWAEQCQVRLGIHPVQVCHEWNTAVHVQDAEGDPAKRAFTVDELQAFFDHAGGQVRRVRGRGRKGWLSVLRDATSLLGEGSWRVSVCLRDLVRSRRVCQRTRLSPPAGSYRYSAER